MRFAHSGGRKPLGRTGSRHREQRRRRYGATIKDPLTALWKASDRVCGKRLKVMIPILLPANEQHGRLKLGLADRARVLAISAATHRPPARRRKARGERRQAAPRVIRLGFSMRRSIPVGAIVCLRAEPLGMNHDHGVLGQVGQKAARRRQQSADWPDSTTSRILKGLWRGAQQVPFVPP